MIKRLKRLFFVLLILSVLLFILRQTKWFPSLQHLLRPQAVKVDETPLLVTQIKNIAQLMTIEAFSEVVVDSARYPFGMPPQMFKALPGNPFSFLGASQLVLIVKGKVVAGVDLQTLTKDNIHLQGDSLFIQLPHAVVFDVITNPSDVETFIEKGTWDIRAATALQQKARKLILDQSLNRGILTQADAKARQVVYELFKNTGYKHVTVTTAIQTSRSSGKQ